MGELQGVKDVKIDLLPDMWCVAPLSSICVSEDEGVGERGTAVRTRAMTVLILLRYGQTSTLSLVSLFVIVG